MTSVWLAYLETAKIAPQSKRDSEFPWPDSDKTIAVLLSALKLVQFYVF